MDSIDEIPVPSQNGDSGGGTGLATQQLETAGQINYSKIDQELLLKEIWSLKRGKQNLNTGYGMYVEIPPGGRINFNSFAADYLRELKSTSRAFKWSMDFGKVTVGVSSRKTSERRQFTLAHRDDPEAKSFKLMNGVAAIRLGDFITQAMNTGGQNLVVINNAKTTVEGLLITLTHMLDELVWQKACLANGGTATRDSYESIIDDILTEGITLHLKNTEEILESYILDNKNWVRLYGNHHSPVPFVMGYVRECAFEHSFKLTKVKPLAFPDMPSKEKLPVTDYEVLIGITTAKQIHTGHLLLYLIADSVAGAIGSKVTIAANNTGPRIAQTILGLKDKLINELERRITNEQAQALLSVLPLETVEKPAK